MGWRWSPLP